MCGRYVLKETMGQLKETYDARLDKTDEFHPSYNVAPTNKMPIVVNFRGSREIRTYRWGLIPSFISEASSIGGMINARAETIHEKRSFAKAFRSQRCVVPANGFYEWKKTPDGKQPYYFTLKNGSLFSFAGIYEIWRENNEIKIESFSIITTPSNIEMKEIHDRMPAILQNKELDNWLDSNNQDTQSLQDLLRHYPNGQIQYHPVSKEVNSPRNQGEGLISAIH